MAKKKVAVLVKTDPQTMLQAGDYADAHDAFFAIKPPTPESLLGMAECSYYLKNDTDCINCCMGCLRLKQKIGEAYYIRGLLFLRNGDKMMARQCFATAAHKGDRLAVAQLESMEK